MKKTKKKGSIFIWIGIVLILAAACWAGYNYFEDWYAGKQSDEILASLDGMLDGTDGNDLYKDYPDMEMPSEQVGETFYCGVLSFPGHGVELPVTSQYDESYLNFALTRWKGSAYKGNMIIAGHNTISHFRVLYNLQPGDQVIFTDMDGNQFIYEMIDREVVPADGVDEMQEGNWDLTLFTCTFDNSSRVTIRLRQVGAW